MAEELIIRMKLMYDDEFAIMCLLKLYELQEADEQDVHSTQHRNGIGFNKSDAQVLSDLAEVAKAQQRGVPGTEFLPIHLAILHETLPKYAAQLSRYLTEEEVDG